MLSNTRQYYIPNFKQLSLEKRIFLNILLANPISPGIRLFWTNLVQDHYTKLQTKFQVFQQRGSEEEDWMLFYAFCDSNPGPSWAMPFSNLGPSFEQLGKWLSGNVRYKILSIWPKWFWRRFLNIFYVFLWFKLRTPWSRAILDHGATIWTNLVNNYQPMLHTKFQAPEPSSSREVFLVHFIFEPKTPPSPQGHFWP